MEKTVKTLLKKYTTETFILKLEEEKVPATSNKMISRNRNLILHISTSNPKLSNILIKYTKRIENWTILREKAEISPTTS